MSFSTAQPPHYYIPVTHSQFIRIVDFYEKNVESHGFLRFGQWFMNNYVVNYADPGLYYEEKKGQAIRKIMENPRYYSRELSVYASGSIFDRREEEKSVVIPIAYGSIGNREDISESVFKGGGGSFGGAGASASFDAPEEKECRNTSYDYGASTDSSSSSDSDSSSSSSSSE